MVSNYGLIGEWTRQHRLGLAIDSTSPSEIAKAFEAFVREDPNTLFDPERALEFALSNSPQHYARTLAEHILVRNA